MQTLRQKEIDEWAAKVVVANKHFSVNSRIPQSQQIDKMKGIREDPINKIGLRLSNRKVKHLQDRQISATKDAPIPPVSTFLVEEYVGNEQAPKALKGLNPDFTRTPLKKDGTQNN